MAKDFKWYQTWAFYATEIHVEADFSMELSICDSSSTLSV